MRIAIVNDDMPFLVDSVANAIAQRQLTIHRLLHPVVCVTRDASGKLKSVEPLCGDNDRRESMMYIELDRAHARGRKELVDDLKAALADVRAAVRDWPKLQAKMREDAAAIEDPEGRALMKWFADGAMTLLGYEVERAKGTADRIRLACSAFRAHRPTRAGHSARCAISSRAATFR